jgi:protein phosphatase
LTHDHTVVQGLIDRGVIGPVDAATHPMRHLLLNVIGTRGDPVRVEIDRLQLADGDQILLCLARSSGRPVLYGDLVRSAEHRLFDYGSA